MSVLETSVGLAVRLMPAGVRDALRREFSKPAPPRLEPRSESHPTGDTLEDPPPWNDIWRALIDASASAARIADLLGNDRAFFDFENLVRDARKLGRSIENAYSLMCRAPRFEGLDLERGDNLNHVREQVDLRRAELLDSTLPTTPPSAGSASGPVWTVHYRPHGGFTATAAGIGAGSEPCRAWGMATTPRMAEHVLRSYAADRPPATVTFDPALPEGRLPLAGLDIDHADLSELGPKINDVLSQRGAIYDQHIAACEVARDALREHGSPSRYLAEQAALLNETDPQLERDEMLSPIDYGLIDDYRGFVHTVQWIPTSLVVGTGHQIWGDFGGHRDRAPLQIAEGLLSSDLDKFTDRFFGDPIRLERALGWSGPLYRVSINGNHRIHTARMLNLPWILAKVDFAPSAMAWDMLSLITSDRDHSDHPAPIEQRVADRAALVRGLIDKRIVKGHLEGDGLNAVLACTELPAPWLLRPPEHAADINAVYESRYPGALARLGIPPEAVTSPEAWSAWASK